MSKLQFFLITSLITSTLLLLAGNRDTNSIFPIAIVIAVSSLANRYISENLWDKVAIWGNNITGRKIFRTKLKRLPPSKSRRVR
jgi:hypothetical protein